MLLYAYLQIDRMAASAETILAVFSLFTELI